MKKVKIRTLRPAGLRHAKSSLRHPPSVVYRVRTELPLVALSFDDGPHPEFTPQVLEVLKQARRSRQK